MSSINETMNRINTFIRILPISAKLDVRGDKVKLDGMGGKYVMHFGESDCYCQVDIHECGGLEMDGEMWITKPGVKVKSLSDLVKLLKKCK